MLDEGSVEAPDACAAFTSDAARRRLTGSRVPSDGLRLEGPSALCDPLLEVRGIIA